MMTQNVISIFVGLVLGWLSLISMFWIFRLGRGWWRLRKYGDSIDHDILLVRYGGKLTNALDRDGVEQVLTRELPAELSVSQSVLLLPSAHHLHTIGKEELYLPINHTAVRWVASSGQAQRSTKGRLRELIEQGRTDLMWTQVWVPLMRGTNLVGLWLLGERETGLQYSPVDIRWLTSLAREAAAVLEAMKFAEKERQISSEMRTLYRQVVEAREEERGRLSRELHDGVLQDLCAVARDIKALEANIEFKKSGYKHLVTLSNETVQDLRAICNDLRPPLLQQNLTLALKTLIEEMDARSRAPVYIEITTQQDELSIPDDKALTIFRITQEALNNAILHSDASEIAVRLTEYPDKLRLTITDDGQGIQGELESARFVAGGHFGIAGMRERAAMIGGNLEVQTSFGYGTVVILELPC